MKLIFKQYVVPATAVMAVGAIFIAGVVVLLSQSSARAKNPVNWNPPSVSEIVFPGSSETIAVSFTASRDIGDVTLEIVPELEPYVSVSPESFANTQEGDTKNVQLTLSPPPADPVLGSFVGEGTIHVRPTTTGRRTIARPLPIRLFGLPRDPGEAGTAPLEGVDADGDGIRDDVQRLIALEHPDSARTRAALTQYAKATLDALIDAESKADSIKHAREVGAAIACLWYVVGDEAPDTSGEVRAEILNTDERSRAYMAYDTHLSGQVFPVTPVNLRRVSCAFDVDSLPN